METQNRDSRAPNLYPPFSVDPVTLTLGGEVRTLDRIHLPTGGILWSYATLRVGGVPEKFENP
jgi:hypothetical protein